MQIISFPFPPIVGFHWRNQNYVKFSDGRMSAPEAQFAKTLGVLFAGGLDQKSIVEESVVIDRKISIVLVDRLICNRNRFRRNF